MVIRRAFRDARGAVKHEWRKTAIGFIAMGIAAGGYAYVMGGEEAWTKIRWWLFTLGGAFSVFLVVLLYQIPAACWKLYNEAAGARDQAQDAAKESLEQAEKRIGELEALLENKVRDFDAERRELIAEAERARNHIPERVMIRAELERFVEEFEHFKGGLERGTRRHPLDLSGIEKRAQGYIRQHYPHYTHFADDHPILDSASGGAILDTAKGIRQCEARIKRLKEVLRMLG
jgi:hypothetical protein